MKILMALILMFAAAGVAAVNAQVDKRVTDIRSKVSAINKAAPKYTRTKKVVTGISTEGAEATLYHSGSELKKIAVKIYGETFNATSEFYFDNGVLIFEYDRVNRYDTQIGLNRAPKVVKVEQYRCYFDGGSMFRLIIGKKVITPGSNEFAEQEESSKETVRALLEPEPPE